MCICGKGVCTFKLFLKITKSHKTCSLKFEQSYGSVILFLQLFKNEMMVAALVDRVTFNSQILNMNCTTSYRMETALNGQPTRRA